MRVVVDRWEDRGTPNDPSSAGTPPGDRPPAPFTVSLPVRPDGSPRGYCPRYDDDRMGDFLVIVAIVAFVILMLALIKGLERI